MVWAPARPRFANGGDQALLNIRNIRFESA
jgi:hypothetical protein